MAEAAPDAATGNVQKMYDRACADIQEYSETIKRLEARRDAATAELEAVKEHREKWMARAFRAEAERDEAMAYIAELEGALTKECRDLASSTVYTAAAMGSLRLTMGEAMVKLGYEGLRQKLSRTEARITEAAKLHQCLVAPNGYRWCSGCSTDEYPEDWPCSTAIALGLNEGEER